VSQDSHIRGNLKCFATIDFQPTSIQHPLCQPAAALIPMMWQLKLNSAHMRFGADASMTRCLMLYQLRVGVQRYCNDVNDVRSTHKSRPMKKKKVLHRANQVRCVGSIPLRRF